MVFVEFVAFLGFGPGWLVLSMALQLKDLLFLLSAVRDLLCFGWYLLNLLVLLVSGWLASALHGPSPLQLQDLLFLLPAVWDLLSFDWYLLNLLVLLVSGLAGYSSLWGHRLFS